MPHLQAVCLSGISSFQAEKYGKVNRVFPKQQKYTSELKYLLHCPSTALLLEVKIFDVEVRNLQSVFPSVYLCVCALSSA